MLGADDGAVSTSVLLEEPTAWLGEAHSKPTDASHQEVTRAAKDSTPGVGRSVCRGRQAAGKQDVTLRQAGTREGASS